MDTLLHWNSVVNGIVWGPAVLALLVGTGIWFSAVLGFPQLRYLMARQISQNLVVMPKKPDTNIHNRAPGPPWLSASSTGSPIIWQIGRAHV